jgi:hypothetical protein
MKLLLNLQNERISLLSFIDFHLWELMYELNRDIIQHYQILQKTDTTMEYIFQFIPFSFFPSFYTHMLIHKQENTYQIQSVKTPDHLKPKNCIQLETLNDTILILGTDHNLSIEFNFDLPEECELLEPSVKHMFKKIVKRIKTYIESL